MSKALGRVFAFVLVAGLAGFAAFHEAKLGFDPYSPAGLARSARQRFAAVVLVMDSRNADDQALLDGPLRDPAVKKLLRPFDRYVVDGSDPSPSIRSALSALEVQRLPTLIFRDREGHEVARLTGVVPRDDILAAADRAAR